MKLVLVSAPFLRHGEPTVVCQVGVIMLATVLRDGGYRVEILDVNDVAGTDAEYQTIPDRILAAGPDAVGFSTTGAYYPLIAAWAKRCKTQRPSLPIVFGGPHASVTHTATLESFPFVDIVARGESERSIVPLVRALSGEMPVSQVPGVSYRNRSKIEATPCLPLIEDLDSLPDPDYSLFPTERADTVYLEEGRGCPYGCAFCFSSSYWQRRFRMHGTTRIVDLMERLQGPYGDKSISFIQDTPFLDDARIQSLCTEIENRGLAVTWDCYSRLDLLSKEVVEKMVSVGCESVFLGIETGSQRLQQSIGKNLKLDSAVGKAKGISTAGMKYKASFILGFPDETRSDLLDTVRMIMALRYDTGRLQDVILNYLAPLPGTKLLEGRIDELRFDEYRYGAYVSTNVRDEVFAECERSAELFSSYYHLPLKHLDRKYILRVQFLLESLMSLPYCCYVLYRDPEIMLFDFLANGLDRLELNPQIYKRLLFPEGLRHAAQFILDTLSLKEHFLSEVFRYELAVQQVAQKETESALAVFERDIFSWTREVERRGYGDLHEPLVGEPLCLLFRKSDRGHVSIAQVPFALAHRFGLAQD